MSIKSLLNEDTKSYQIWRTSLELADKYIKEIGLD